MDITLNLTVHSFKEKQPEKYGQYLIWFNNDWAEVVEMLWNGEWNIHYKATFTKEDLEKAIFWAWIPTKLKKRS